MPFDLAEIHLASLRGTVDAEKMTPRERLLFLRDFLRSGVPDRLWDYTTDRLNPECDTAGCAIGWWNFLTGREPLRSRPIINKEFGIEWSDADRLFFRSSNDGRLYDSRITPSFVADEIDLVLAERAHLKD